MCQEDGLQVLEELDFKETVCCMFHGIAEAFKLVTPVLMKKKLQQHGWFDQQGLGRTRL